MQPYAYRPPQTANKALLSLALGLMSVGCLGAITGLPAIVIGAMARRDIDSSGGSLRGRAVAAGGIVSGLFGTGFGFVVLLYVMGSVFAPPSPNQMTAVTPPQAAAAPTDTSGIAPVPAPAPRAGAVHTFGSVEVVDLNTSRPLRTQLAEIARRAHGRTVVLQTVVRTSSACAAVDAALPDLRMQRALANVTLVRVDIAEYDSELDALRVETRTAPWFYKLDAKGTPMPEAISADTWGSTAPEAMAPVLGKFVHRARNRRH